MTPEVTPEGAVVPPGRTLSANDLYYLKSIYGQLNDTLRFIRRDHDFGILLGIEILADNLDWLDCFIEQHSRELVNPYALGGGEVTDPNGHEWRIGRFQTDDESECRLCGIQSDERRADEPCPRRGCEPQNSLHRFGRAA